jgi:tetratricopeptide (TPR) repeat protein
MCSHGIIRAIPVVFLLTSSALVAQSPPSHVPSGVLEKASSDLQKGNATEAEKALRAALQQAPRDPSALGLLGAILDSQNRYGEAEIAYKQALALAPGSPGLLNNLGNHYMAQDKTEPARAAYLKVVAAQPHHANANLQLAQLCVAAKQGATALKYLNRLPAENQAAPPAAILRARALKITGQDKSAQNLLAETEDKDGNDPRVAFSIGMTFVEWKRYAEAENAFARALDADPTHFDILYNLGLAAQHAGHLGRALEVYQVALKQRPNDPDCLFNLAVIYTQTGQTDQAIVPLMQAHNLAPERADILIALAQASQDLGFYADAVTAIEQYLRLKPNDDVARRERGFCRIRAAKLEEGLEDLRWYVQKHPEDARGFYELAIAETVQERDKALQHLDRALSIDPKFGAARYARGVLYYQMGRTEESIADLKLVLTTQPDDFRSLDALAQDEMRLGEYAEATKLLESAMKLAPKDPRILTHYSRALIRVSRKEEAEKLAADFRALGPEEGRRRPYGGLFDFLNLPPEQQYAKYLENLQRTIAIRPDDPNLRVQMGKTLLREGKTDEAIEAFRTAHKLSSTPDLLATCGKLLVDFDQYAPAREFLEPLVAANPHVSDSRLSLAIAVFHSASAGDALKVLDETPTEQRKGDYFLLLAQILDAMQKPEEAAEALNHGLNAAPTRADLYFEAATFLIKHKQYRRAIQLLDQANHALPDSPALQLIEAIAYEMVQQYEDSLRILAQVEARWPEWSLPYELHGVSLETRVRSAEARRLLETAISLGANDPNVYYYLASAISHSSPDDVDSAQKAIEQALVLNRNDAYIQSLAGRIDYERKEYPAALEHLQVALRLWPEMVEAHQNLAGVYRAMGEKEKSIAELKEIVRIKQENPTADQTPPFPVGDLLFSVRPSSHQPVETPSVARP